MATAVQKIASLGERRDIPFNKLILSQANVRKTKAGVSISELAEDIGHRGLLQIVAFDESIQCLSDQGLRIRLGLAEDFGIFDIIERLGHDLVTVQPTTQRLERTLSDLDSPYRCRFGHGISTL